MKSSNDDKRGSFQSLDDFIAFSDFMTARLVDYFNEKAVREPTSAKESQKIAHAFQKSAQILQAVEQQDRDLTRDEEVILKYAGKVGDTLDRSGEMRKVEEYAAGKLDSFISEDPDRWERLQGTTNPSIQAVVKFRK